MTCKACGYDTKKPITVIDKILKHVDRPAFIELRGCIKDPFYSIFTIGKGTEETGTKIRLYACPKCGTVKMEV
jgi:hypothetical protein